MTAATTATENSETTERDVSGTLKRGESATIFAGAENATFEVQLFGRIQPTAKIDVLVDGSVTATLTPSVRSTVANGKSIRVTSLGRDPQTFLARPR